MTDLRASVDRTVAALPLTSADDALVALVRAYADELDERHRVAAVAERAVRDYAYDEQSGEETEVAEVLRLLRARLAERETLDRLGARLHAGLVELGASPRARAKGEAPRALPTGPTALSALRGGTPA